MTPTPEVQDTRRPFPTEDYPSRDLSGLIQRDTTGNNGYAQFTGGAADIWNGTLKEGNKKPIKVAIKVPRSGQSYTQLELASLKRRLNRETWTWSMLKHENILKFLGVDPTHARPADCPALISPYCENGTIINYLNQLERRSPGFDRLRLVRGVARGLEYLHSQKVVHGDLKPSNILIGDSGQPLLCDFGCSKALDYSGFTATKAAGTCRYQAPEILNPRKGTPLTLTAASDVYAFGISSFEIWAGRIPYEHLEHDAHVVLHVIVHQQGPECPEPPPTGKNVLWPIMEKCWSANPDDRLTMEDVVARLST